MSELEILYPQIPLNALTIDENPTSNASYPKHNITTGSRSLLSKISTPGAAITNKWYQFDLGLGISDTANYLAIARADLLRGQGCTSAFVRPSSVSRNLISDLALASLKLHLDADKEVTVDAQRRVSAWGDQSGNNYDFTQSTDGNKPVLSRADNKENRFQYSEQINHANWNQTRSSVSANAVANPIDGQITADLLFDDATAGSTHLVFQQPALVAAVVSYRISCYAKYNGRDISFRFDGAWTGNPYAHFNLQTGAVHSVGSGVAATIESVGNGWYRCSATCTTPTPLAGTASPTLSLASPAGTVSYNGDSVSGCYVWGAQFSETAADTTYILTTDHLHHKGINGYSSLVFDGSNDTLTSTAILSNVIANNAATVFIVMQSASTVAGNAFLFRDNNGFFTVGRNGGDARISNDDGAADNANAAFTINTPTVIIARHASGNIRISVNNGAESTTASGNTTTLTNALRIGTDGAGASPWAGKIAEILVCNADLTSTQRTQIYTYLATKYVTAAAGSVDIEKATLLGPHSQDLITTFSATAASRYYWLDLHCAIPATTCLFPLSKAYLGTRFNFSNKDPIYPYTTNYRKPSRPFVTDSGTAFRSREGREQLIYGFNWFVSDDVRDDFMLKIGKYWDVNPIMLWTSSASFDAPLNGHTLVHGSVDTISIKGDGPVANSNRIFLEVMQDV